MTCDELKHQNPRRPAFPLAQGCFKTWLDGTDHATRNSGTADSVCSGSSSARLSRLRLLQSSEARGVNPSSAHHARFIFFNTPGHAAERRSDGSNGRIRRGMNAGKRCSTALADHSTACSTSPRARKYTASPTGPPYASPRRATSRAWALSACPSLVSTNASRSGRLTTRTRFPGSYCTT